MASIKSKREVLKGLFAEQREQALADRRATLANMYTGYIIRVDAGRYDDRLDQFIAEAREDLATKKAA